MKNKTVIKWACTIFFLLLIVQCSTNAALLLPESDTWHGGNTYTRNGIQAYVEYAVYDSGSDGSTAFPTEFNNLGNIPDGRYLYAYRIAITGPSTATIGNFQIIAEQASGNNGLGSIDAGTDSIAPDISGYESKTYTWSFGGGVFVVDKASAFLVITSDCAPVKASDLSFSSAFGDDPSAPGIESAQTEGLPEPATIALLSIGALIFRKR
jgi:hypothetical protein